MRLVAPLLCLAGCAAQPADTAPRTDIETQQGAMDERLPASVIQAQAKIENIEERSGGRLGFVLRDPAGRVLLSHRGDERFAMCSTFKPLLAAMILSGDSGLDPDTRLTFDPSAIAGHAPYSRTRSDAGWMTVAAASESIVTVSDNFAANLLLHRVGGPRGLTDWVRGLGDEATRLDRREPELNENAAGDPRDTTSPLAFAQTYHRLLTDKAVLGEAERATLIDWMIASRTGLKRVRAGLPADWKAGDKTGYCAAPGAVAINDIAIFDPDGSGWYTLVFFLDRPREAGSFADALGAEVGALAAEVVRSAN
ncbi:MAG: class A beta-lactamase [Erythrobacter sp.]|nr:class A beta-lactamase [Erythrobacter sp.]NCQ62644.1 class A beta-lactamase [Alphaproteobacteria bacterium]